MMNDHRGSRLSATAFVRGPDSWMGECLRYWYHDRKREAAAGSAILVLSAANISKIIISKDTP